MKKIVFTEEFCRPEQLAPFTLTRQIQDLRVGILTIREKWELALGIPSFDRNEGDYKDIRRSIEINSELDNDIVYLIHGNIIPSLNLIKKVKKLKPGEFISVPERESIVYCISQKEVEDSNRIRMRKSVEFNEELKELWFPWDLFRLNQWAIEEDFRLLKEHKKQIKLPASNWVTNAGDVFIEKGARVEYCFINASEGPVYIAKGATIMEGSMIRGPVSIGEGATVKMGSKIYGATTIGPGCIVGGEIKNSVFFGYSNKAHDGYIGDSVIGEWCNMGAGTSNSNIKNTASPVQVWTPSGAIEVGLKCGVLMGDYSRTAINTAINTGTVIGVSCNVFGNGLTPKYIPNFSWGSEGVARYEFDKALRDIANWKSLKQHEIDQQEAIILKHIFDHY